MAVILWAGLRTPAMQTIATQQAIALLSKKTGTKITVDKVRYRFSKNLLLKNFLLLDQQNDTLVYIKHLSADIDNLDINNKHISLSKVKINHVISNITPLNDSTFNYSFFIDSLKKENPKNFKWNIECHDFNLSHSNINISSQTNEAIVIDNLDWLVRNIEISAHETAFDLDQMSFVANDSLEFKKMNFSLIKHDNLLSIRGFNLLTKHSHLYANKTKILISNKKEENRIQFSTNIHSSKIKLSEYGSLYSPLLGNKQTLSLTGLIKGDANDLAGNNIHLTIDKSSSVNVDFVINNLSNRDQLKYNITAHEIFTNKYHIEELLASINDSIEVPDELDYLGDIFYSGMLKGTNQKLLSKGSLLSDLGLIETNLTLEKKNKKLFVDGNIQTSPLYLDKFLSDSSMGAANINIQTQGYFDENSKPKLTLNGSISEIRYNAYELDSIAFTATLDNRWFEARLSSFDPNLRMDCNTSLNFDSIKHYGFELNLYTANLEAFGLSKSQNATDLSFNMNADLNGANINEANGFIQITDLFYFYDSTYFATDSLRLNATNIDDKMHYDLTSEFIDGSLIGQFNWVSIISDYQSMLSQYLPAIFDSTLTIDTTNNFKFNINLNYPHPITELFNPEIRISPGTRITGDIQTKTKILEILLTSDRISYQNQAMINFALSGYSRSDFLNFKVAIDELKYSKGNSLKNFNITAELHNDSIMSNVKWNNWLNKNYSGSISSLIGLKGNRNLFNPDVFIDLYPSRIIMNDTLWKLSQSSIYYDSTGLAFKNLEVNSGSATMDINGKFSKNPEDSVDIVLHNVNLVHLNTLIKGDKILFGGTVSGKCNLQDLYGEQKVNLDLEVDNLTINKSPVGKTHLTSHWNVDEKLLNIQGHTTENSDTTFWFLGDISPSKKSIYCNTYFNNYNMSLLEAFMKPTFLDISGRGTGEILLNGTLPDPSWEGFLIAENFKLKLEPTNVDYFSSDTILFSDHDIHLVNQEVNDLDSNVAILNGNIHHSQFKEFSFDINIESDIILALNTRFSDNPLYHGTAYGKGIVEIKGPTKELNIGIVASTLKNTKIFIPLEGKGDIKDNEFISFYDPYAPLYNTNKQKDEAKINDLNKPTTNLNLNLTVTPEAEVQIIFDPQIGDMLTATGNAEITMEAKGDEFFMYGDYMIYKGEFLFTLQNVINKKLNIQQGSHVSWSGDPINADINLDAVYKVRRASIYELTLDENDKDKRVPVNCHLLMTNKLLNPDIKFRVEVPTTTNNEAVEQINSLTEDEINKQVLSLILMNKFTPLPGLIQSNSSGNTASLGATTASELLSNQLSSWLSQVTTEFEMGFVYRPKDEYTEQEYEFALSTTLWDDRVAVNGNFGYNGNQNTSNTANSPYTTDLQVELKLNPKGNIRLTAFQKVNNDYIYSDNAPYTYGIGVFYTEEFNDFDQLMTKMFRKNSANKPKELELEEKDETLIP